VKIFTPAERRWGIRMRGPSRKEARRTGSGKFPDSDPGMLQKTGSVLNKKTSKETEGRYGMFRGGKPLSGIGEGGGGLGKCGFGL